MFIAAAFTIRKIWKQPKCPSVDEWIKQIWCIYTVKLVLKCKKKKRERERKEGRKEGREGGTEEGKKGWREGGREKRKENFNI